MTVTFDLSVEDAERLFLIKDQQGRDDLTGNQFARRLLENELYRLCPHLPEEEE